MLLVTFRVKINEITKNFKSREKWDFTSLDFKKADVFHLIKSLDRFLGTQLKMRG